MKLYKLQKLQILTFCDIIAHTLTTLHLILNIITPTILNNFFLLIPFSI